MATRQAYGLALAKLGESSSRVVALDGDTKNSTFSLTFMKSFPDRYIECFIAEQNMVIFHILQRPFLNTAALTYETVIILVSLPVR